MIIFIVAAGRIGLYRLVNQSVIFE